MIKLEGEENPHMQHRHKEKDMLLCYGLFELDWTGLDC